jgi:hypothetical protein
MTHLELLHHSIADEERYEIATDLELAQRALDEIVASGLFF